MADDFPAKGSRILVLRSVHYRPDVDPRKSDVSDFRTLEPKSETSDFGIKSGDDELRGQRA
ncbi:hypothetical protein GCM10007301_26910 [Azorhizobium oxalatiphilum]|uniref:Uncharacterized protein n=1 Tax=Azorhizobium oxalatiphilum TaxID=980631 RepID=A0A917C196_9HYPH|nr:hypothetical protein GCM10007301_26910 [Azorhizobium oxalatiphilum]